MHSFSHGHRSLRLGILLFVSAALVSPSAADVKPGDVITRDNASQASGLLPPSVELMLRYGMKMTIVPYERCPLPKADLQGTEKFASQVKLGDGGRSIENYV